MASNGAVLSIRLRDDDGDTVVFVHAAWDELLQDVLTKALRRLRIADQLSEWSLMHSGANLPLDMAVGRLCERLSVPSEPADTLELAIVRTDGLTEQNGQFFLGCLASETAREANAVQDKVPDTLYDEVCALEDQPSDFDCLESEDDFELGSMADLSSAAAGPADVSPDQSAVTRRSTVRYFSKMNPERVYPLLVTITERRVEKVRAAGTRQATGAEFQLQVNTPLEIEPIIPGCECYPQRITAITGKGDYSARFHVAPSAVGRIDGAVVVIRQSHIILSKVPLDVTVIPQTRAMMSAAMTFAAPAASAAMNHFGLDFNAVPGHGNFYLSAAHLLFDQISPLTLTLALASVTGGLAWHAWPRSRELIWEVQTRSPAERLRLIAAETETDPARACHDLIDLIEESPDLLPARLLKARMDRHSDRDKAALMEYLAAFKLGDAAVDDYQAAYELARKHGTPQLVLTVLEYADQSLSLKSMPSRMTYNLACFQARCGQEDNAMRSLRRALASGYGKMDRARTDSDLRALWSRQDFRELLKSSRGPTAG